MKQGEIWLINLDPTVGAEIKKDKTGDNRERQCFGEIAAESHSTDN
jgi:hypothetical protein